MNHPPNASNVSSAILKILFAGILLALIFSPVISAGRQDRRQDSTQPKIKTRIIRVDRLETEESEKAKRAELQRRSQENTAGEETATSAIPCDSVLFLGDIESVTLFAFNYQPNSTVTFTTVQTNPGVIGFSATQNGPFVEEIQFSVTVNGSGSGFSSPYFVKGLTVGFTSHYDTSPETVAVTAVDYNVIPHCNCPPIPVIP